MEKQDASGQLYMRNRYFDPQSGRFTQEDPIGLAGGLNLYGFGGGDAVNYSDPFGLCVDKDKEGNDIPKDKNECERFASYVDELARNTNSTEEFVRVLGEQVAGFEDGVPSINPPPSPLQFGDSGFRNGLTDGDGHAPRHFVAYVSLAYFGGGSLSRKAAFLREVPGVCNPPACSLPDVRLGLKGTELGEALRRPFFSLERNEVADWIRREL